MLIDMKLEVVQLIESLLLEEEMFAAGSPTPTRIGSVPPRLGRIPVLERVTVMDIRIWIRKQADTDNRDAGSSISLTLDLLRAFNLAGKMLADGYENTQIFDDRWPEATSWELLLGKYLASMLRAYTMGYLSNRDPPRGPHS